MEIKLLLPTIDDAHFWLKVRTQPSTQNNNPIGILNLEELKRQVGESNQPMSKKQKAHRYFIQSAEQWAGVISLKDINWDSGVAELGYLIDETFQSKGVATEAVRQIVKIAFNEGNLNKIKATTIVQNVPSYRVLEKNSFKKEGVLRQEFLVQGKLHDVFLWSLLKSDL